MSTIHATTHRATASLASSRSGFQKGGVTLRARVSARASLRPRAVKVVAKDFPKPDLVTDNYRESEALTLKLKAAAKVRPQLVVPGLCSSGSHRGTFQLPSGALQRRAPAVSRRVWPCAHFGRHPIRTSASVKAGRGGRSVVVWRRMLWSRFGAGALRDLRTSQQSELLKSVVC